MRSKCSRIALTVNHRKEQKEWRGPSCFILWDEWAEEVQLTQQAVEAVNKLCRRPKFMVLVSSLHHAGTPFREGQARDLKVALRGTDTSIPLVFVSENHDLGNTPTLETVAQFCNAWGDDYFSFLILRLVFKSIHNCLFFGVSACPDRRDVQEAWLEGQLQKASQGLGITRKQCFFCLHCSDEEESYSSLKNVQIKREDLKAVFSGHYHCNAVGWGAARVVVVTAGQINHRYHSLEQLSGRGMGEDLRKPLQV
uniref:Calcineurin-like phosphoesterase domain containing 1 n=1 Tax=Oncorhynchus mykiss TaxID=8022 RepID=A0A8C7T0W0_ONCMY